MKLSIQKLRTLIETAVNGSTMTVGDLRSALSNVDQSLPVQLDVDDGGMTMSGDLHEVGLGEGWSTESGSTVAVFKLSGW